MKCKECEYSCGYIETCKLKSSECYQNKKIRMKDIRKKAIKFEAEMYGVATNQFVDGFMNGYQQGTREFAEWLEYNSYLNWVGEGNDVNSISAKEVLAEWQKGEGQ